MKGTKMMGVYLLVFLSISCTQYTDNQTTEPKIPHKTSQPDTPAFNPEGTTLAKRFTVPEGYERIPADSLSFGHYLRQLPLKPDGSQVKFYNGATKPGAGVYKAVVDLPISARDLHQCADAVMRLRGEYLFARKEYRDIHFNFLSDGKPRYYLDRADASRSYKSFLKYMDYIFAYANTASLLQEMKPTPFSDMQIGDVFIVKGNPYGHAIIVVDMAKNPETGASVFMLAQSYMPAQETQILLNPNGDGVWYSSDFEGPLYTPEWTFEKDDLRRF